MKLLDRLSLGNILFSVLHINVLNCHCNINHFLHLIENVQTLVTVFAIIGRMFLTGNFGTIFICTSELYPTMMRYVFNK
jgi:hypothetical protein